MPLFNYILSSSFREKINNSHLYSNFTAFVPLFFIYPGSV